MCLGIHLSPIGFGTDEIRDVDRRLSDAISVVLFRVEGSRELRMNDMLITVPTLVSNLCLLGLSQHWLQLPSMQLTRALDVAQASLARPLTAKSSHCQTLCNIGWFEAGETR